MTVYGTGCRQSIWSAGRTSQLPVVRGGGGGVQPCVAAGGLKHQYAYRDRGAWKAVVENRLTWVSKVSCICM